MIRDGVDVHYYTQPVDSADQVISLVDYLTRHGFAAIPGDTSDEVAVPLEASSKEDAADSAATVFMLIQGWRLYWEHSDAGVFELTIYSKD